MGCSNLFGKKPDKHGPVLATEEVLRCLLVINHPSAPYRIIDGKPKGVDLIAEWKVVDATWHEIFAKANLTNTEKGELGQVYSYRFNTKEIKKPIQEAAAACGWRYKGVVFGELLDAGRVLPAHSFRKETKKHVWNA